MRNFWLVSAIAAGIVLPGSALAKVYDFHSTETSAVGNPTFSFSLDTTQAEEISGVTSFSDVTIYEDGVKMLDNTISLPSSSTIASPLFFLIDTDTPVTKSFDAGSGADVTFNIGTFTIADGNTDGEGTLTISAAPEPGAWALMVAGLGVVGAFLRIGRKQGSPQTA